MEKFGYFSPQQKYSRDVVNNAKKNSSMKKILLILYDYRILYTLFSHLQETEAMTTLSKTESKYLLLNL